MCVHIIHIVHFHPATISLMNGQISIIQRLNYSHACRLINTYYIIALYLTVFILLRLMSTVYYILAIPQSHVNTVLATLLLFFSLINSTPLLHWWGGGGVGDVLLLRCILCVFLCPLSMATGYLSVLLQSLGGAAHGFLVFLQPSGGALIGCARNRNRKSFMHMVTGFASSETYSYYLRCLEATYVSSKLS